MYYNYNTEVVLPLFIICTTILKTVVEIKFMIYNNCLIVVQLMTVYTYTTFL